MCASLVCAVNFSCIHIIISLVKLIKVLSAKGLENTQKNKNSNRINSNSWKKKSTEWSQPVRKKNHQTCSDLNTWPIYIYSYNIQCKHQPIWLHTSSARLSLQKSEKITLLFGSTRFLLLACCCFFFISAPRYFSMFWMMTMPENRA